MKSVDRLTTRYRATAAFAAGLLALGASLVGSARSEDRGWHPVWNGVNGDVNAIAAIDEQVYVAGGFDRAGGISGIEAKGIARWDGTNWHALGTGLNSPVRALAVSGTDLYAGGEFTHAGGELVNYVAKWDGTAWSPLHTGVGFPGEEASIVVEALAVSGSDLYVAGRFDRASGVLASRVAKWDGENWSNLGDGIEGWTVRALAVTDGVLYAGGEFTGAGGIPANYVAKWDGSEWSALGEGVAGSAYGGAFALAIHGGSLYAGGSFIEAGGGYVGHVARWDGNAWSGLGTGPFGIGVSAPVYALDSFGGTLYAGGDFLEAGGGSANCVALWDGTAWHPLGDGTSDTVQALAGLGEDLFVGGRFAEAGGIAVNRIARYGPTKAPPVVGPAANRGPTLKIAGRRSVQTRRTRHVVRGSAAVPEGSLARVEVRDQRPRGRRSYRSARGTTRWSFAAPLREGRNRIEARAVDAEGLTSPVRRVVVVRRR